MTTSVLLLSLGTSALSGAQQAQAKPFLIQGKLPHLSMMVKVLWDDEDLALTQEQKSKLLVIRQETMSGAKALGAQIRPLETEIVQASLDGTKPEALKEKVAHLASLRARATMIHLDCIYNTRAVLTKEQLYVLE